MNFNVDLANNKPLAKTIIKLIRIIIDIENSTQEEDKPALISLKLGIFPLRKIIKEKIIVKDVVVHVAEKNKVMIT